MEKQSFATMSNNGVSSQYNNTCFWISISDFLKYVKGINLDPDSVRNFARFPGTSEEFFDFFNDDHRKSAQYLCNELGIGIDFHYVNIQKMTNDVMNAWLSPCIVSINSILDDKNRFAIALYGNHFEFITSKTDKLSQKILIESDVNNDKRIINYIEPLTSEQSTTNVESDLSSSDINYIVNYLNNEVEFYQLLINTHNKELELLFTKTTKFLANIVELKDRMKLIHKESEFFDESIVKMTECELCAKSTHKPSFKYVKTRGDLIENKLKYDTLISKITNEITVKSEKYKSLTESINSIKNIIMEYEIIQNEHTKTIEVLKSKHN